MEKLINFKVIMHLQQQLEMYNCKRATFKRQITFNKVAQEHPIVKITDLQQYSLKRHLK